METADRAENNRILLEERRAVARRIGRAFGALPDVSAIFVSGSVALGHVDERSDVDMMIICGSRVLTVGERVGVLAQLGTGWKIDEAWDNPVFGERGDKDGVVDGIGVELHYQSAEWMDGVIEEVLVKGAIRTEKVPFRPYTMVALLLSCWLLEDRDGIVVGWRERARVYPEVLKRNVVQHFLPILQEQTEDFVKTAERRLGAIGCLFHLFSATDALTSILYALNERYDLADRRGQQVIWPQLQRVPANFVTRLTEVLEGPFDAEGAIERAYRFQQLAEEVVRMVAQERFS